MRSRPTNRNNIVSKNRNLGPNRRGISLRPNQIRRSGAPVRRPVGDVRAKLSQNAAKQSMNKPVTLNIANLHFKVTEQDMKELFSEFGKLSKISLHYDKNGKPQGTCDIKFAEKSFALKAIKKYNKVPLDGRPMELKLVENYTPVVR